MGVVERLSRELLNRDVALDRESLFSELLSLVPHHAPLAKPAEIEAVLDGLVGLGPVEQFLADTAVTDILVNRYDDVWVERAGHLERTPVTFSSPEAVLAAIERAIAPSGLRLDRASPSVDARLADGSRLHATLPPISIDGPAFALRRFVPKARTLLELEARGALDHQASGYLADAVRNRRNIVVTGGTGSGKTTLLNVLSGEIPSSQRTITVEDSAELSLHGHILRLESRPANAEGAGQVTVQQLVRNALRLRPDRIIVGEVRGPEALDMISAMNTGHDGSMSTVHANGPDEALWRIETLALSGERRVSELAVQRQLQSAIHVLVHTARVTGGRRVVSIHEVDRHGLREVWGC
ncbi:MAG: Flp pilus assembly complex ATPase component TadA [Acidimicrobiia bacterium]|nr:Flp pilus assembly complex ATPase component TadA [Acidimicrobiia bacterium]NNL27940.1 CpaF family protein [Acidimicrobiia bacterium]